MTLVLDAGVYLTFSYDAHSTQLMVAQDAATNRDREFSENLDGMLQDPDYDIRWNVPIIYTGNSRAPASTTTQPPAAPNASSCVFLLYKFLVLI